MPNTLPVCGFSGLYCTDRRCSEAAGREARKHGLSRCWLEREITRQEGGGGREPTVVFDDRRVSCRTCGRALRSERTRREVLCATCRLLEGRPAPPAVPDPW